MKLLVKALMLFVLFAMAGGGSPMWAQEATPEGVVLVPHTLNVFGIQTVVPDGWTNVGNGIFTRQNSAADRTALIQQSAPLNAEFLLNAILPQLALTEAPESVGTYAGAVLEWTLYQVDVNTSGVTVKVDLALSEVEGTTYIVWLSASPEEYEDLHTSIFLPTLDAFAPLVSEATEEAVPYTAEEVTFENGDVTLAGTLTLPPTDGPHPVVVLVSGSGPQNRDEALGGGTAIKPFRLLADGLTRAGVAVLRYDDRGVGESTGTFSTATIPDFATDAAAAIDYLLTRDDINPDQIGLLGHSEGGYVAAMLGASNPELDFIISLAGPGVNGRDLIRVQQQRLMETEGSNQAQIEAQIAFLDKLYPILDDPQAVEALTHEYILELVQALPEAERAKLGDLEQYVRAATQQTVQQYSTASFKSFIEYDPAPDWAQTTVPVLAIFGGKDVQVDAEQNAPAVEAALKQGGNQDYEVVVLPDANHLFQQADTGGPSEYSTLPAEFTPDLLPTIIEWLQAHVSVAE
jgi:pimeloyl-ACP methyl ester carboxylesterase